MNLPEPISSGRALRAERWLRWALIFAFAWLVAQYWDPYYGFTQLLQCGTPAESRLLPSFQEGPVYVYHDAGGYDGQYYAQLATSPGLHDPGLLTAIDNLGYRARRMLLSWVAWLLGAGQPVATARAYAWLNIAIWFGAAALLWRLFPPGNRRGTVAWAGVLFTAGVLLSVRFSLTDLTALVLVAAAVMLVERNRNGVAAGVLGFAGLARETALLGAVALWPAGPAGWRDWLRVGLRVALAILPSAGRLAGLSARPCSASRTLAPPISTCRSPAWPKDGAKRSSRFGWNRIFLWR